MLITGPGEKAKRSPTRWRATSRWALDTGPKPAKVPRAKSGERALRRAVPRPGCRGQHTLRVGVKGDRDPGYGSTSKMITEAAVRLLHNTQHAGRHLDHSPALARR